MHISHKLTHLLLALTILCCAALTGRAQDSFPASPVSDQQAGWMLAYPYYTSNAAAGDETFITISNVSSTRTVSVHLYLMEGRGCTQADMFLCLTPNASTMFRASELDPENTGYILAYAVNPSGAFAGCPDILSNTLIGNAHVKSTSRNIQGNYGAEAWNSSVSSFSASCTIDPTGAFATLNYPVPRSFAVEIQSPVDVPSQTIVLAGLSGDISVGLTGAGQSGTGVVYNGNEKPLGSFTGLIPNGCHSTGVITRTAPRVPGGMAAIIPAGNVGTVKFNATAAVGLLMVPNQPSGRHGIRTLHKIGFTRATLNVPVFMPGC